MNCPECLQPNNRVLDSNVIGYGKMIKRRRECRNCHHRWTTIEQESDVAEDLVKQAHKIIKAYDRLKKAMGDD